MPTSAAPEPGCRPKAPATCRSAPWYKGRGAGGFHATNAAARDASSRRAKYRRDANGEGGNGVDTEFKEKTYEKYFSHEVARLPATKSAQRCITTRLRSRKSVRLYALTVAERDS